MSELRSEGSQRGYGHVVTITARAAGAAVLALILWVPTGPAQARAADWTTVSTVAHAKVQACKDPTKDGPWKIRVRVNARNATKTVHGSAMVQKDGQRVGDKWRSGRIHPGEVSTVGTLELPRGSAYQLEVQLSSNSSGTATLGPASMVHRC